MISETFEPVLHLSQNIAVLLAFTSIYNLLTPTLRRLIPRARNLVQGVVFGFFGIFAMLTATSITPGFLTDGRSIVIAVAGVSGGPVAAAITAAMVGAFRIYLGGAGAIVALATGFTAAVLGCGFWWLRRNKPHFPQGWALLILGVTIAVERALWSIVLGGEAGQQFAVQFFVPSLALFTVGTWLLGISLFHQQQHHDVVEALDDERAMLRTLIDNVPDYIFIKDQVGRFILSNIAHAHAAGATTVEELLGKTAQEFFPQLLATQYNLDDQRVMQGETIIAEERQTVDKEGNSIWVTTTKVPIRDRMGHIAGIIGISRDVTQTKRSEEALLESERKFRQIVETATEGIWMIDIDFQTTFVNPRMAVMLGYTVEELIGKSMFEFMDTVEGQSITFGNQGEQAREIGKEHDFKFLTKDGQALWTILSTAMMVDEAGDITGALVMVTDITERKQAEAQALQLAAAQQRVQVLKRFIIDMSHDFRTPLSIIQTSLFLLKRTATDQQQRRLDVLEAQTGRLTMLLEALNEVYELESEDRGSRGSLSDVNATLKQIVENIRSQANEKQLIVKFSPEAHLPPILLDLPQFERAIAQIVNNALHYTPPGGVVAISSAMPQEQLVITVQDTGIGITPDDLPHIFEHFYRADHARSTETGGNGLGLAIAQKIIKAHGGRITVASTQGQGSTFQVILPIRENVPITEFNNVEFG
jgi:PAS domain S-box-containing protein